MLFAALLASGCAASHPSDELPDHLKPRVQVLDPGKLTAGMGFTYRELSRDDFQASEPLPEVAAHARQLGALTCAYVVPARQLLLEVEEAPDGEGFLATAPALAYQAEFISSCSWWNAESPLLPPEYGLRHEQMHFAITELAARDATARGRAAVGRGPTRGAATRDFQRLVTDVVRRVGEEMLERQTRFDQETALYYQPKAQERWWRELNEELERTDGGLVDPVADAAPAGLLGQ